MSSNLFFTPSSIGIDEVGRGPIAGPLVVCACYQLQSIDGIKDSKQLSENKRNNLAEYVVEHSEIEVSVVSPSDIDRHGIFASVLNAMRQSADRLIKRVKPNQILIDGTHMPAGMPSFSQSVIKGDQKYQCIASASIVAKVIRDHIMERYARLYPGYGFDRHKGYGTTTHYEALSRLKPCPIHRRSFRLC